MASDILTPSRRGFLGLFGAATATAAMGGAALAPAPVNDWRAKPVGQWTKADFVAEAEFELAAHTQKAKEVFRVGMSWHDQRLYRAHQEFREWWRIELLDRVAAAA